MSISFHCECCKKKIKAPDDTGGKWGNCPHCKHRCYIPMPENAFANEEELVLEPVDESEEKQYQDMMRQTRALQQEILHETAADDDVSHDTEETERELFKNIIIYLRQMADGELFQAEETEKKIAPFGAEANNILKKMAKAENPEPELADVAPKVLLGLIKGLAAKL